MRKQSHQGCQFFRYKRFFIDYSDLARCGCEGPWGGGSTSGVGGERQTQLSLLGVKSKIYCRDRGVEWMRRLSEPIILSV